MSRRVPLVTISLDDEDYGDDNVTTTTIITDSPQFRLDGSVGFVEYLDYDEYQAHSPTALALTTIPTTPPRQSPSSSPQPIFLPETTHSQELLQSNKPTNLPRPSQKQPQQPQQPQPQQQIKPTKPVKVTTPPPIPPQFTESATLKAKPRPSQKVTTTTTTSPFNPSLQNLKPTNSPRSPHTLKKSTQTEIPSSIKKDTNTSPIDTRSVHTKKNPPTRKRTPSTTTTTHSNSQAHASHKTIPSSTISLDTDEQSKKIYPPIAPHAQHSIVDVDFIDSIEKELEVVVHALDNNSTYNWNASLNSPLSSSRTLPFHNSHPNSSLSPNSSRTPSPRIKHNNNNSSNSNSSNNNNNNNNNSPLSSAEIKKKPSAVNTSNPNHSVKLPHSPKYKTIHSSPTNSPKSQKKNSTLNGSNNINNHSPSNNIDTINKSGKEESIQLTTTNLDDVERLLQIEKSLRAKEEALKTLQNQLRQRETQVFILEEQTIAMMENEDKRLKEREERLLTWERELQLVDVRRKIQDDDTEGSPVPSIKSNNSSASISPAPSPITHRRNLDTITSPSSSKIQTNSNVSNNIVNTTTNSNVSNNVNTNTSNNNSNTNSNSNSNNNNTDETRLEQTMSPKRKKKGGRKKLSGRSSGNTDKDCVIS